MARQTTGCVILPRQVMKRQDLLHNHTRWAILNWIIMAANWQDGQTVAAWEGKELRVARGMLVTSIKEMSEQLGCARTTIRNHLEYLTKSDIIRTQFGRQGTLITICNYDKYQDMSTYAGHKLDKDRTSTGLCLDMDVTHTIQEYNLNKDTLIGESVEIDITGEFGREGISAWFVREWNDRCGEKHRRILQPHKWHNRSRLEKLTDRWLEERSHDYWTECMDQLALSENWGKWKFNLDWLIRDDTNHRKVMEGQYQDADELERQRAIDHWAETGEVT